MGTSRKDSLICTLVRVYRHCLWPSNKKNCINTPEYFPPLIINGFYLRQKSWGTPAKLCVAKRTYPLQPNQFPLLLSFLKSLFSCPLLLGGLSLFHLWGMYPTCREKCVVAVLLAIIKLNGKSNCILYPRSSFLTALQMRPVNPLPPSSQNNINCLWNQDNAVE